MEIENNPMQRPNRVYSFMESPRCGAKTRQNTACKSPSIRNKQRCRMHGGKCRGAPIGNQYAIKNGFNTGKARELRKSVRVLLKETQRR